MTWSVLRCLTVTARIFNNEVAAHVWDIEDCPGWIIERILVAGYGMAYGYCYRVVEGACTASFGMDDRI